MLMSENLSHAYLIRNTRTEINATPKKLWPYLLRFEEFNQTFEKVEVLSGAYDKVGSVSLLTKMQGEWFMPPYLVKIVRIVPEKQIVWTMFPQIGDGFFAFVDWQLVREGEQTVFVSNVYSEARMPRVADAAIPAIEEQMGAAYDKLEGYVFPILKRLAEG
jgi:hypothetical protein